MNHWLKHFEVLIDKNYKIEYETGAYARQFLSCDDLGDLLQHTGFTSSAA